MLAVLAYHASLPLRGGFAGVDVFFVISGFLITSLLLRELAASGTVRWGDFLARRVRRLLPAAAAVLVTTAVLSLVVVPGLRRREIGGDITAAAGYVLNWVLAGRSVDYLAEDAVPSPVQHFWSLGVEEQFYLLWPASLLALALAVRRLRRLRGTRSPGRGGPGGPRPGPPLAAVAALLAAVAVPSFVWSLHLSAAEPARAYFVTTARAWELGVGAAAALVVAARPTPLRRPVARSVLGWAGLVAVVAGLSAAPADAGWPGTWALLPTLGTAAVLLAGSGAPRGTGPSRVLGASPLVRVGGLSYALYLWHWPLLVLAGWAWGELTTPERLAVVAASVVPAWLSTRYLEGPVRRSPRLRARPRAVLAAGLACSLVGVGSALPLLMVTSVFRTTPPGQAAPDLDRIGANTLASGSGRTPVDAVDWVVPDPEEPGTDRPAADVDHCQVDEQAVEPVPCVFGRPRSRTTVALVGDSKAMQWLPALQRAAGRRDWRIVTYGKSSCAFADATTDLAGAPYRACTTWNDRVLADLLRSPPDLVVTSSAARRAWSGGSGSSSALAAGLARRWDTLRRAGVPVLVLGDNPVSPDDLDVCAARHPDDLARCDFPREAAVRGSAEPVQRAALRRLGDRAPVFQPVAGWTCPGSTCPVVIGHVTVNRPGDHITATYAATLADRVEAAAVTALRAFGAGRSLG